MTNLFYLFRHSLRLKLILVSVTIEVLMLALLLGNSLRLMNGAVEQHTKTLTESVKPLLDVALSGLLFERNFVSLNEVLENLLKNKDSGLAYVIVYDDQNNVYISKGKVEAANPPAFDDDLESAQSDKIFDTYSPLQLGQLSVGTVRYGISLDKLLAVKSELFNQGILIAATEVFLTILLLSVAGYFLTQHIKLLLTATRNVSSGDYESNIHISSQDEIGELAKNFNKMTIAIRDKIHAIQNSERALFNEKEKILVTLESIGDGVITTDTQGRVELLNPVAERLTGWKMRDALGRSLDDIFIIKNEISRRSIENPVSKCLATRQIVTLANHTILESKDGTEYPIEDCAAPIMDKSGDIIGVILVFHDVSGSRHMARQMAYQARHDSLTGLVNRGEFETRVKQAINAAKEENRTHALLYMDLDQFKIVNDTCGHFAGDELLRTLSLLLNQEIRDTDTIARLGGDEFGILFENCSMDRAIIAAEKLRSLVEKFRFEWSERSFEIGISIGLVQINNDTDGISDILSAADVACYIAKENGRNRVHIHHSADEEHVRKRNEMQLVSEISAALENNRFALYYQNITTLVPDAIATNNYIEILVRMIDVDGKLIQPNLFIPAAERFHLMSKIDKWVITNIISFMNTHNLNDTLIAINLSGHSIAEPDFLEFIVSAIHDTDINPRYLCFEITETAVISNLKQAIIFITKLKSLGCFFALDDFGSGLSSFAYLKNLDVDFLKIDGTFIKDMLRDDTDAAMVEAINQIGHIMGLKTIAEYVEDNDILKRVKEMHIDFAQGYGLHLPSPIVEFIDKH